MQKSPAAVIFTLLTNYSFEVSNNNLIDLIYSWLKVYPGKWVITATVEAIYQGRYKVNSVSRILEFWGLKGYPIHHFDYDFADVVCKKLIELEVSEATLSIFQGAMAIDPSNAPTTHTPPKSDNPGQPVFLGPNATSTHTGKSANLNIHQCERLVMHLSA